MTAEEEGFFQAILDNPKDDAVRLVYADWLEEHDQSERAEFIRIQCEQESLSLLDPRHEQLAAREKELHPGYEAALLGLMQGSFPESKEIGEIDRGIPIVYMSNYTGESEFEEEAGNLGPTAPLCQIQLTWFGSVEPIADFPWLKRAVRLILETNYLSASYFEDSIEVVLAVMDRMHLMELELPLVEWRPTEINDLFQWPGMARMRALDFGSKSLSDTDVVHLARSEFLNNLRELNLSNLNLTDEAVRSLEQNKSLNSLRRLDLTDNAISEAAVVSLAGSRALPSIEVIHFGTKERSSRLSVIWVTKARQRVAVVPAGADAPWWW
jgi:uncharacterized protein (TIGR02996 family)